jgi:hypothetical protein
MLDWLPDGSVILPPDWQDDEKGNTWITDEDTGQHLLWVLLARMAEDRITYLEIELAPQCSPSWDLRLTTTTPEALAHRIVADYAGFAVNRWGLPGDPPTTDKDGTLVQSPPPDDPAFKTFVCLLPPGRKGKAFSINAPSAAAILRNRQARPRYQIVGDPIEVPRRPNAEVDEVIDGDGRTIWEQEWDGTYPLPDPTTWIPEVTHGDGTEPA